MRYPRLTGSAQTRSMIDAFRAYNHNPKISDNEFYDMRNMSSDEFPLLCPRQKRSVYANIPGITGIIAKDSICFTDGEDFVIGGDRYPMGLNGEKKQLVSMGAYVIILPDKKYINTIDPDDRGDIEARFTSTSQVTFSLCKLTGETYGDTAVSDTAPNEPENGALWIDTSSNPHALKQYASATDMWVSIATTYILIEAIGIGKNFQKYDAVKISGVKDERLKDLNANMVIMELTDNAIVVTGILDEVITQDESITLARKMPNMDYVVESENRLWGCRYGLSADGEHVNEIYASKLGDFKNWNCFMGLSTDSYAASCGTDGAFTGAITHRGYPLFFKENHLHKVYGNYPANFQIQASACRGVQKGSAESLAVVNEVVYYKAVGAVCAFDGSMPTEISYCLGNVRYKNAVGGGNGSKYYISMQGDDGAWHHLVWDSAKSLWHKEDNFHSGGYISYGGQLYAIDADRNMVLQMTNGDGSGEIKYSWMVQTGEIGLNTPDSKYVSKLTIRMNLEMGTEIRCFAQYDFSKQWEPLFAVRSIDLRSVDIPIKPKRCDFMRLRIEGDGYAKIYSIAKTIMEGSSRT